MAGAGAGEDQEESGPLVFQRGKKLNDEYYIISVRDNAESACVRFSAYELESSETCDLSYSYVDFDALFKSNLELVNPVNKEGRYDWVIDRLDFTNSSSGSSAKRLTLAAEPTAEDEGTDAKASVVQKVVKTDRLTYAERVRLRQEAEKLEEKRAATIAIKSEKNRKAFVSELQEKQKLEELKVASRRQRIDEERAERHEKAEMQKHVNEERMRRYEDNDKKREVQIHTLEAQRNERDLAAIKDIIDSAAAKKELAEKKLEEAKQRKAAREAAENSELATRRVEEEKIEAKRDKKIEERNQRLKQGESDYLEYRKEQIAQIAKEKQEKNEKKAAYLQEKAALRAAQLREKHEQIESWEQTEDMRTQNNMTKEHSRNMLMIDHIDGLRQTYSNLQQEAAARKQQALEDRKEREAKVAEETSVLNAKKQELQEKREKLITGKEDKRRQTNHQYCQHIRDMKTEQVLQLNNRRAQVEMARDKIQEERMMERQHRHEQDMAAASINAMREANIRKIEKERDQNFARQVREEKEKSNQHRLEADGSRHMKRQQEKEAAEKKQEQMLQKSRQVAVLDEQRDAMIKQRALERNQREQERKSANKSKAGGKSDAGTDLADSGSVLPPASSSTANTVSEAAQ